MLYTTARVSPTVQGTACPYDLYYKSSSGAYIPMDETMYYEGSSKDYYTRSKYADAGELYEHGGDETVTVGVEEYSPALYTAGTAHSGGLYTDFELASISTRNVTALTV